MFTRAGVKSKQYFGINESKKLNQLLRGASSQKEIDILLDKISNTLMKDKKFHTKINQFTKMVEEVHKGIDDANFTMRFQTYAVRVLEPIQVYMDLFSGYLSANRSKLIVGVNIVAPENNHISLNDYTLHMQMYNYLLRKYPSVHRSLHAGELTLGMVRPKNLTFHINEAIDIAHAQRVGHAVDLPYETNNLALLKKLKEESAIEINFSSNEFILGVKENEHPYTIYASYGVPLVISTDDSGVSRNNLSHEYVLLASRYHPTYAQIKRYVYNSIKYSFLTPKEKIINSKLLDKKFTIFENEMANLSKILFKVK